MWCRKRRSGPFDISRHSPAETGERGSSESSATPVRAGAATAWKDEPTRSMKSNTAARGRRPMSNLPDRFRELLVLRELEGLSYRELADVMGMRIGTVMSRLSRARQAFRGALNNELRHPGNIRGRVQIR